MYHPAVEQIARALVGTGYEGDVFAVGGCVRDSLMGLPPAGDIDLVTSQDAEGLARFLFERGLAGKQPEVFTRFGTAMVIVDGARVEIVRARSESYSSTSRKPDVQPASYMEDARRRDFTVNTLQYNLKSGETIDLLGQGLADLDAKILRTPLDPVATFRDDPLRMMRAVRFRHRLGFGYAPGLFEAMRSEAGRLQIVSQERIQEEFNKVLMHGSAPAALDDLMESGLLAEFAPELAEMRGVTQGDWHDKDVWGHTLAVVRAAECGSLLLKLSALCHDIGKPPTRTVDATGAIRFFSHENVGADIAAKLLDRMRYSDVVVRQVWLLVKNHMRLNSMETISDSAGRRLVRQMGDLLETWLDLVEADAAGLKRGVKKLDIRAVRARLAEISELTPRDTLESPLSGDEIMAETGLPAGPGIGEFKAMLLEAVLEGNLAPGDKEGALALLRTQLPNATVSKPVSECD